MRWKTLLLLFVGFVVIQSIRPALNWNGAQQRGDLFQVHSAPADVRTHIQNACYDCHSENTRVPWYAEVQPVRWWLAEHVREGREHLNFSQFTSYPPNAASRKLRESIEEIEDGEMPLASYTWLHSKARLTPEQRRAVVAWLKSVKPLVSTGGP